MNCVKCLKWTFAHYHCCQRKKHLKVYMLINREMPKIAEERKLKHQVKNALEKLQLLGSRSSAGLFQTLFTFRTSAWCDWTLAQHAFFFRRFSRFLAWLFPRVKTSTRFDFKAGRWTGQHFASISCGKSVAIVITGIPSYHTVILRQVLLTRNEWIFVQMILVVLWFDWYQLWKLV